MQERVENSNAPDAVPIANFPLSVAFVFIGRPESAHGTRPELRHRSNANDIYTIPEDGTFRC